MNRCLVFGNNYFAEMMCEYLEEYTDTRVEGFLVNRDYVKSSKQMGKEVFLYEDLKRNFKPDEVSVLVTCGYKGMNTLRRDISETLKTEGFKLQSFIHPDARIYADEIGKGNIILEGAIVGKHVVLGNGNIIWNGANISHHTVINNYNFFAPSCAVGGKAVINNNCFFGLNSTVKGGIVVKDYTLIGAAAYVKCSTNLYDVYVPGVHGPLVGKNSMEILG